MRKFLVIVTTLVLTACGSSPKDPYERRAYEDQKQREAAYEAEKLKRQQMIERIRQRNPNILRIKGT